MALKAKQKLAAEIIVANPSMNYEDVAKQVGVDDSTLWRWRQREDFKEYEHILCMDKFRQLEKLAVQKLKENAEKNNQKAIEYILDYLGYVAEQKVDIKSSDINITITDGEE